MDRDGNRFVSPAEFIAFWMVAFNNQDMDGDDRLTANEFGSPGAFRNMDTDGDGFATVEEYQALYMKHFRSMEKDGDGQLGVSEL